MLTIGIENDDECNPRSSQWRKPVLIASPLPAILGWIESLRRPLLARASVFHQPTRRRPQEHDRVGLRVRCTTSRDVSFFVIGGNDRGDCDPVDPSGGTPSSADDRMKVGRVI